MRTIGVTGGAGFIGGHVIDNLLAAGHDVISFDHLGRRHRDDYETMLGDVRDPVAMVELAAHCDGIIHLAAVLGTQETIQNPTPAVDTNIRGGLNFLEAISQYDIPGVYIAVGNHWMNNAYSISKTAVERFCRMHVDYRGTRVGVVRAVNAYGPRQVAAAPYGPGKVRKIMPAFICRALSGAPIEVYGDGEQISDMVYVADVAQALVSTLQSCDQGKVPERVIEVGPFQHHTVNEVAEVVCRAAMDPMVCNLNTLAHGGITHLPMRPGETPGAAVTANPETLWDVDINPHTMVSLTEGVRLTVDWFAENRGVTWQ